jgi:hypothetical protein
MKTNQLELLSKNLFADVGRINEDLKYFSADERRRVSQDILSHNTRRENRSGTVNFVPPVNKFETKLINSIPIIDTPYMTGRNDTQISPILDIFIQNNSNNNEEEGGSLEENNNNNNNARNSDNNANENRNNSFVRNINVDSFHIEFKANNDNEYKKYDINMGIIGVWILGEKVVVILCKPSCDTNSAQKHYGDNSEEYFVVFVKKDKKDDRNS